MRTLKCDRSWVSDDIKGSVQRSSLPRAAGIVHLGSSDRLKMVRYDVEHAPLTQDSSAPVEFRETGRVGLLRRVAAVVGCAVLVVGAVAVASLKNNAAGDSGALDLAAQVPSEMYDSWDIAPDSDYLSDLDIEMEGVEDAVDSTSSSSGEVSEAQELAMAKASLRQRMVKTIVSLRKLKKERKSIKGAIRKARKELEEKNLLRGQRGMPLLAENDSFQFQRLFRKLRRAKRRISRQFAKQQQLKRLLQCETLACVNENNA